MSSMSTSGSAFGVAITCDVPARMRDGTVLRANVYRPDGDGPWPVLLTRTPYDKEEPLTSATLDPVKAARQGFMVVVQDTRGRFTSGGDWTPFRYERQDGYDTVEWAARLPGSNGRVGMYGGSYCGNTQWAAAIERPPSLTAIAPLMTWSNPLDGLFKRGGALELGTVLAWTLQTGAPHIARQIASADERQRHLAGLLDDIDRLGEDGYRDLPVHANRILRRYDVPDLGTLAMLADPGVPEWSTVNGCHERVDVPSISLGGWYDIFVQGTLDNYMAMRALGRPARLLVGPWRHGDARLPSPIGELSFGMRANGVGVPAHPEGDVNDVHLAFFRRHIGQNTAEEEEEEEAPVRIFVMGRNIWRDESSWPLERARQECWFLGPGGTLRTGPPTADSEPTEFVYDSADPVPTVGGPTFMSVEFPPGAFDQTRVEARPDVLVFTSEPLRQELEVTGRVRVVLHATSSAPSTDWVARLCDVHPDGRSVNLCDGIRRIERDADRPQRVEIDLWSTSNVFLPGHRLRVHVTSSSFPRWDRNLNTGDQRSPRIQVARQSIRLDSEHPSWIKLPIVD